MRMKRGFVKNSLENVRRSAGMGKQLHFTQAQLNRNKDFVDPVLDSSRAVPPIRTRVRKAQNEIGFKSKYWVRSFRLSFKNFSFDFNNASYSKMTSNFVILLSL